MSKNEKMMDLLGHINSKYIDEATYAKKLSGKAGRRFSLGNVAVIVVGLMAVSIVTLMAFWLTGNLGEQPTHEGENGPETGLYTPTPSPYPAHTPYPSTTPAPSDTVARAHIAAEELLIEYPTIFLNLMSRHLGLTEIWDQIRSHVDYTGADFLFSRASTMDESYLMDGQGNIITAAPFLIHVDGPAIAWRYFLFDEGNGIPLIIVDFQPHWIGGGRYHMFIFDGENFVPIDSTAAGWHTMGGGIEAMYVQPYMNDAGDIALIIQVSLMEGRVMLLENGVLRNAGLYSFEMVYEWADHVVIWQMSDTLYSPWEEHARLTREEFEAYRESPAFFSIFPDMPEGDFRALAPMPDLQAQLDADVYRILRQQTPESTLVAAPAPTPNPRTEYIGVEDNRSFDYFMELIRETGIHIVTPPQDNIIHPEHEFIASMWFNGEYWVTSMYEFETVFDRVIAMDMMPFWRAHHANGRFIMETNHPWLGGFFEGIPMD